MRSAGAIFHYPYRWLDDASQGLENPKDRVTCLVIARTTTDSEGVQIHHLLLVGITDSPRVGQVVVEIPDIEKRRAGLSVSRPAFLVLSEYNYDVLPMSWNYDRNSADFGVLSPAFTADLQRRFFSLMKSGLTSRDDRTG